MADTTSAPWNGVAIKDSKAQYVAGRDINISVTLQLRSVDLRSLMLVLGDHLRTNSHVVDRLITTSDTAATKPRIRSRTGSARIGVETRP